MRARAPGVTQHRRTDWLGIFLVADVIDDPNRYAKYWPRLHAEWVHELSMFSWNGKGDCSGGMSHVIKIRRKLKGIGCEAKTVADEGKEAIAARQWHAEQGATISKTFRLTMPWHGSGQIVTVDSWFASVRTAVQLRKHGLYFLGPVKTAHRKYPVEALKTSCPAELGGHVSATSNGDKVDLLAIGWRDRSVHTFVGTCGTTILGQATGKRRINDDGRMFYKTVKQPKLMEEWQDGAPALDIYNHLRQEGLALESAWGTHKWYHRVYASALGIIEPVLTPTLLTTIFEARYRRQITSISNRHLHFSWSTREISWRQAASSPSTSPMKASPQQARPVRWWLNRFWWLRRNFKGA